MKDKKRGPVVFAVIAALLLGVVMFGLFFLLRRPSPILTPAVFRSPLRRFAAYTWSIGEERPKDVTAVMTFSDACELTISGAGRMLPLVSDGRQAAWRTLRTESTGWTVTLQRAVVENGVTNIGAYAFAGCTGLEHVRLPATLEAIDACAFSYCGNLREILFEGDTAQWESIAFSADWSVGCRAIRIVCRDGSLETSPQRDHGSKGPEADS